MIYTYLALIAVFWIIGLSIWFKFYRGANRP